MADFFLPPVTDNPTGWGPCAIPEKFKDMPYQPFTKSDRLGKVSDWTGQGNSIYNDKKYANKYTSQYSTAGAGQYSYYHEQDDKFQIVDTLKPARQIFRGQRGRYMTYQRGRGRGNMQVRNNQGGAWRGGNQGNRGGAWSSRGRKLGGRSRNWQGQNRNNVSRKASVDVKQDWDEIEYYDFAKMSKAKLPDVAKPQDLYEAGKMEFYEKKLDKVNTKSEMRLKESNKRFPTVTTTSDPIIRKLASKYGTVYATDVILSTLMCCTRSVNSWDIVASKVKGKIFLDKREDSLAFDCLTVNETAYEAPSQDPADINSAKNLSEEATHINYCFSQQALKPSGDESGFSYPHGNPFEDDEEEDEDDDQLPFAPIGYRYRMWDLGGNINLVCRTELDAVSTGPTGNQQLLTVKSLNEFDFKTDWRHKLDAQPGAVIATELKNNSFKIGKWCLQAYLAGSNLLKVGFVSRVNPRDNKVHEILKVQTFVPDELAQSINLNFDNCWGILRSIVDVINRQPEEVGKYLILKDPNKAAIRVYKIPMSTFSDDEDDEDDIPEENEKPDQ